jgi:hypothetical protein
VLSGLLFAAFDSNASRCSLVALVTPSHRALGRKRNQSIEADGLTAFVFELLKDEKGLDPGRDNNHRQYYGENERDRQEPHSVHRSASHIRSIDPMGRIIVTLSKFMKTSLPDTSVHFNQFAMLLTPAWTPSIKAAGGRLSPFACRTRRAAMSTLAPPMGDEQM